MARKTEYSARQRRQVLATQQRRLNKMKPEELDAFETKPVWDKAQNLSEIKERRKNRPRRYDDMPTDVDSLVKWAEQKLAEGKLRGFEANAQAIARRQGIPIERARAILAAGTRAASPAAKRANPRLRRVRGKKKN